MHAVEHGNAQYRQRRFAARTWATSACCSAIFCLRSCHLHTRARQRLHLRRAMRAGASESEICGKGAFSLRLRRERRSSSPSSASFSLRFCPTSRFRLISRCSSSDLPPAALSPYLTTSLELPARRASQCGIVVL